MSDRQTTYAVAGPRPEPTPRRIPVRGEQGRLYGYYDPATHTLEVKRGAAIERIALPLPDLDNLCYTKPN